MTQVMKQNPYSTEEQERLLALHRYGILDTPPEKRFDDLVSIAATACDAPIAWISFIDEDRQWFKSHLGFNLTQTHRLQSFCHYALQKGETMVIPDAKNDIRFHQHPLVTEAPHVRFYAGALITTRDGHHIGTLCVMDFRPRDLLSFQKRILEHLAHAVALELDADLSRRQIQTIETKFSVPPQWIAHEINNPLAVIQARMGHLKRLANGTESVNSELVIQTAGKVEKVIDRIQSILRGLRPSGERKIHSNHYSATLSSIIYDTLFLVEDRLAETEIDLKIDDLSAYGSISLQGNHVQICQALLNLLLNAIDAIQEFDSPKWIRIQFQNQNDFFQIRVSDSAPAIPDSIARRLFQPFFTTKRNGKGTGLGLNVSRSFIESFGGTLVLDQEREEKAFVIELRKAKATVQ